MGGGVGGGCLFVWGAWGWAEELEGQGWVHVCLLAGVFQDPAAASLFLGLGVGHMARAVLAWLVNARLIDG